MDSLLFVYGTLLDEDNEYALYLKNNSRFYAQGRIKGRLYDMVEYPGAVLTEEADRFVYGNIVQLDNAEKILAVTDDYEGFGEEQEKPNLFTRVLAQAETTAGSITCWVYAYNLPVDGCKLIETGRYIK